MEAIASYYDGRSSECRQVMLSLGEENLRLYGVGIDVSYPIGLVTVTEAIGSIRRSISLPGGGMCEVEDLVFLQAVVRRKGRGRSSAFLHSWERSLPLVAAALVVTVAVVVLFLRYGVPALASHVAEALPVSTEAALGRESLAIFDRIAFKPSQLPEARRRELARLFQRMTATEQGGRTFRLEFRRSDAIGANAMALPSGIVVVTDGLVKLAKSDDEIAGVLAHELGHVRRRHLMRHVLQNSVSGLIIATITGDILSVTSLSATLPTALVDAKFSRDFEREADDAAVSYLKKEHISLKCYAEILARLEAEHAVKTKGTGRRESGIKDYLSTHPETGERIRRIMAENGSTP